MSSLDRTQQWVVIILSFILLLVTIVGGYLYGGVKSVEGILESPGTSGKFDIDANVMLTASDNGGLQLEYIRLDTRRV